MTYEEMGIVSFSTELWDLETEAGAEKVAYYNLRPRTQAIQAKVFEWVLANVGEQGYREWQEIDHPQLGPVEPGGMVYIWTYRNPPPHMLEADLPQERRLQPFGTRRRHHGYSSTTIDDRELGCQSLQSPGHRQQPRLPSDEPHRRRDPERRRKGPSVVGHRRGPGSTLVMNPKEG